MKRYLLLFLVLAACGRYGDNYQPKLASVPTNPDKYETDRRVCISEADRLGNEAREKYFNRNSRASTFGIVGNLLAAEFEPMDEKYNKTPMQMVDECMRTKGYKVI